MVITPANDVHVNSHYPASMKRQLFFVLAVAGTVATACYQDDPATAPRQGIRTQIMLTDAPFPYDSVGRVDIYIVSIAASTATDTTGQAGEQEWITVAEPKQRYNLLDLQRGVTDTVGEKLLPGAEYRSLRMIIDTDSSSITSKHGQDLPVNWGFAGGRPKLYALVEGYDVASGDSARIVIDFDVGRSFWPIDGGSSFMFVPFIRAVNEAATGTITGTVRGDTLAADPAPIGDVTITVFSGNPAADVATWHVRATGRTTSSGEFRIPYLMPGNYIVRSDAPRSSPFSPGVQSPVTVARGVTTQGVDITLPRRSATNIMLSPSTLDLTVGGSDTLYVYATDAAGQVLNGAAFTWRSLDPATVRVVAREGNSSVAAVTGLQAGSGSVQVCYVEACTNAYVTVGSPPPTTAVATVTISPSSLNMLVGDSASVGATLRDANGNALTSRTVYWHSTDSTVVRVWGFGRSAVLRALKAGSVTIRATSEGKEGTGSVVVLTGSPSIAVGSKR